VLLVYTTTEVYTKFGTVSENLLFYLTDKLLNGIATKRAAIRL
jgi:hypothetical protein